jgi:hypothetical protein
VDQVVVSSGTNSQSAIDHPFTIAEQRQSPDNVPAMLCSVMDCRTADGPTGCWNMLAAPPLIAQREPGGSRTQPAVLSVWS